MTSDALNRQLIDETVAKFGRIDVLVNNAGITRTSNLRTPTLMEEYDLVMATNVRAYLLLSSLVAPHLRATRGNIVNVSSVAALTVMDNVLGHCLSKAAVTKLTQSLASELGPDGIRVNEVNPGFTDTAIWAGLGWDDAKQAQVLKKAAESLPLRKVTTVEEVASVVAHLASDRQSPLTTGLSYVVDSGLLVRGVTF